MVTPQPENCDAQGPSLFITDPSRHSAFLVFLVGLISSDAGSKTVVSLMILLVSLCSGLLPMHFIAAHNDLHRDSGLGGGRVHQVLHVMVKYGNAFSAGVFLAMGVVHLMPEANRAFEGVYGLVFVLRYHPGELLVVIGYALILALQRVVFPTPTCPHALDGIASHGHSHGEHNHHADGGSHHHSHQHVDHPVSTMKSGTGLRRAHDDHSEENEGSELLSAPVALGGALCYGTATVPDRGDHTLKTHTRRPAPLSCRSTKHCVDAKHYHPSSSRGGTPRLLSGGGVSPLQPTTPLAGSSFGFSNDVGASLLEQKDDDEGAEHLLLDRSERIASAGPAGWTLVIALSVHAICEGLALGLQCGPENVVMLGSAICAHKWAESFALSSSLVHQAMTLHHHHHDIADDALHRKNEEVAVGVRQVESEAMRRAWLVMVLFAMATPFGALLGSVMHSKLPLASAGVVKALSAGTFMYIGASEVVVEEFVQGRQYWGKWLCFVGGVGVMHGLSVVFHR